MHREPAVKEFMTPGVDLHIFGDPIFGRNSELSFYDSGRILPFSSQYLYGVQKDDVFCLSDYINGNLLSFVPTNFDDIPSVGVRWTIFLVIR